MITTAQDLLDRLEEIRKRGKDLSRLDVVISTDWADYDGQFGCIEAEVSTEFDPGGAEVFLITAEE